MADAGSNDPKFSITLSPRFLKRFLVVALAALVGLNLSIGFLRFLDFERDKQPLRAMTYLFDVGEELAVVTWIATLLLFTASLACFAASQRAEEWGRLDHRRGFRIMAAVLLYISLDDATGLHERSSVPLRDLLGATGLLYWTWVVPAFIAAVVIGLTLTRFVLSLGRPLNQALFFAGGLFVSCAAGLEVVEAYSFQRAGGQGTITTDLLSLTEEIGEIVAVAITFWTVITYANQPPVNQGPTLSEA